MNGQRSRLPARVSARSVVSAIIMFIGTLCLLGGYLGGTSRLIYVGLFLILVGVFSELLFGVIVRSSRTSVTRRHLSSR
jgi:hypothetical protein